MGIGGGMVGRTKTDSVLRSLTEKRIPVGTNLFLPNHSGDHVRSIKRAVPVADVDLVNKKYVDDKLPVTHASTTGQTADDHHAEVHTIVSHDINATGAEIDSHLGLTNEHLDWRTSLAPITIHPDNYTDTGDTTAHASFTQLDYTSAGHTGFEPAKGADDNFVTNEEKVVIGNTSGTNTGDSHNVASHSDTTATGAELNTLTDNSVANSLHRHSELTASDGSPDPALQVSAIGRVGIGMAATYNLDVNGTIRGQYYSKTNNAAGITTTFNIIGAKGTHSLYFSDGILYKYSLA